MRETATQDELLKVCIVSLALLLPTTAANCQTVRFWLSTNDTTSAGPEEPTINLVPGEIEQLHVWGRPLPGKQLRSFSLNLVATQPGLDFVDGSYEVHNDIDDLAKRFQFVHDSSVSDPLVSFSDGFEDPDGLDGFLGTTLYPVRDTSGLTPHDNIGIGPGCHPNDALCVNAKDGQPAWLIASLEIQAPVLAASSDTNGSGIGGGGGGTIPLYLQIGDQGMRHYAPLIGDYNQNGSVELDDYDVWRATYCDGDDCMGGLLADGNENGTVDAADYTVWRDNLGATGAGVEPSSSTDVVFGTDEAVVYNAGPGTFDMGACFQTNRECTWFEDSSDAIVFIVQPVGTGNAIPEPNSAFLWVIAFILIPLKHRRPSYPRLIVPRSCLKNIARRVSR